MKSSISASREPLPRLARGLPRDWYFDATQYARELDALWHTRWIAGLREEEMPRPGDFRVVAIDTQSILVVRGVDGLIRAFHNTCRHRGSVLVRETQGHLPGGVISCPYHAWTYDAAGALVATPRQMPTPHFDMRRFGLHAVRAECWGGFVFLNLEPKRGATLAQALGELPGRFARYELERLRIGHRIVADVQVNWKFVAENFSECFHCPPVHPELCAIVTAYRDAGAWGLRRDQRGRPLPEKRSEYAAGAASLTLDGTATIPPLRALDATERSTLYVPAMLPPGLFLNFHPDYVHTHCMFPTGPTSVRMVYDWLFAPEALARPGFDVMHYVRLWEITNRQDAHNCELQQQGMRARAFRHGWYVPQEFDCARFARWVRSGLRGRTPARGGRK